LPFDCDSADAVRRLHAWLGGLPRPIGVFACDDAAAFNAIEAARQAGLSVPDEVAMLGVGDDPALVALARPELSSVRLAYEPLGVAAADTLQRMMTGEPPPSDRLKFQPVEVASRGSTDVLTVADPDLVAAVQFIRGHAHKPIQVGDILEAVPASRRSLERRFREHLGRSPQQEIQRVRIETARRLLAETDLTVYQIAAQSGFSDPDRLTSVFRKVVGLTPTDYRQQFRRR
jgi:LacI family transcriptional regulator